MPNPVLAAIYRYPVKSLRGESFGSLDVDARGLALDRRWMIVDADGRFLTQRQESRLALIDARVGDAGHLSLNASGMPRLDLEPVDSTPDATLDVTVWSDTVPAMAVGQRADAWLSRFLDRPCRLVHMPDQVHRAVDPYYATGADEVGFADGFPFLMISQASLDDLNQRLAAPVPMQRFRPNLVVDGCAAFAEDRWRELRIGDLTFRVAKPCSRCLVPNVDLDSGERGQEPLKTLLRYRRRRNRVYFGQNLLHSGPGHLAVGMPVEVVA